MCACTSVVQGVHGRCDRMSLLHWSACLAERHVIQGSKHAHTCWLSSAVCDSDCVCAIDCVYSCGCCSRSKRPFVIAVSSAIRRRGNHFACFETRCGGERVDGWIGLRRRGGGLFECGNREMCQLRSNASAIRSLDSFSLSLSLFPSHNSSAK